MHEQQTQRPQLRAKICLIVIALVFAAFSGCSDPNRKQLVGTWQLEEPTRLEDRITDPSDAVVESRMTIQFSASGQFISRTAMGNIQQQKQGRWKMIDFDEATKTMKIVCEIGGESTEQPIEFEEVDLIRLVPPNMAGTTKKLKFRRE